MISKTVGKAVPIPAHFIPGPENKVDKMSQLCM